MNTRKPVLWVGSTLDDLNEFLGSGVMEIRQRDETGAYRLVYIAKFTDAIYCLHAFQKKTQRTAPKDVEIIKARYRAVLELEKNHD